jgi:cytochrome P450
VAPILQDSDDANHARVRKIFSPAFSERAIKEQEPLFTKYVNQLVQILKDGIAASTTDAATYDLVSLYSFTTFDVMSDLTFGEPLHMLTTGSYDPWVRTILGALKANLRLNLVRAHYPLAAKILHPIMEALFSKMRFELFDTNVKRVTKRLEKGRQSKVGVDLWDLVLSQEEKGKRGLSRGEMDSNATTFMVAGTETTATLLSGLTYLLLTNPECQAKLVHEIRTTFQEEANIDMESIVRLPYLKACISEAFRLYPPVAVGLPHLTPSDGSTICGHFIPPNVSHLIYVKTTNLSIADPGLTQDHRLSISLRHVHLRQKLYRPSDLHPRTLDRRRAICR